MHGVDWEAIREKYGRFVPYCGNRADLNYLIGEMIGELNIGHTYIGGGDLDRAGPRVPVGLLGVDLAADLDAGYHRIVRVVPGLRWDPDARSPLAELGCTVADGDYLVAIDGEEVTAADNPYRFLEGKLERTVRVSTNRIPSVEGASTCAVEPLASERGLRYRAWVERNRALVAEVSGGTIGYLHLPDMMQGGLVEFARGFYPQHHQPAMVIDVRYNGGGFVGDMLIDRLERRVWSMTKPREGEPFPEPERCFHGHLVILVNEDTGSNGEQFAEAVKTKGLAPVLGMRTWGGAVGIEPHQDLVDGAVTTPPQFGCYGLDRRWLIEGRGVEPDVEVQNMPVDVLAGRDAQLEAALELLGDRLAADPRQLPDPPPYPDKSKPAP
jgi:tricorn protease